MTVSNWHRENTYYKTKLTSKCPKKPQIGTHIVELTIKCNPDGSNALKMAKRQLLEQLLIEYQGNINATSRAMGASIRSVNSWLKEWPELRKLCSNWSNEIYNNQSKH